MKAQEKIRKRLCDLREDGNELRNEVDYENFSYDCQAWLVAIKSMLHLLFGNASHPYRSEIESVCDDDFNLSIEVRIGQVYAILEHLITDFDNDCIFSIEDQTRAIVFEDFLEQAKTYIKSNKHREAAVLSAAVFEDAIRSLARKHDICEEEVKTDKLISDMTNKGVLSSVKAKRARAAAGVRNNAMHAQWDDFDVGDVNTLISFTENLISLLDEN